MSAHANNLYIELAYFYGWMTIMYNTNPDVKHCWARCRRDSKRLETSTLTVLPTARAGPIPQNASSKGKYADLTSTAIHPERKTHG
jgi:hypothetical protein